MNRMQNLWKIWLMAWLLTVSSSQLTAQTPVLPQGHAHNDYEHERPLLEALSHGFISVEADVYLIEDTLRVAHDRPADPPRAPTLEETYLQPLRERIEANQGRVYPDWSGPFYLMIDIKTEAEPTYQAIRQALLPYRDILVVGTPNGWRPGPVQVFLSGNRPIPAVMADTLRLAGLDGRPADLGKGYPASVMPVVSDHYRRHLYWSGDGDVPADQREKLTALARQVHDEGKKLRLWASPERRTVWAFLLDHGADLINTDSLQAFQDFMIHRRRSND